VDALAFGGVGLDEPLAVAGQVPQLANGRRGHEAAPQQPVLQQLGQPGRVANIGLAAGQELDVAGVDQQQLQPALLQHIPDGLPIVAGRLQHDLRDVVVLEPLGKGLQTGAERRVGVHLLATPAGAIGHANAGHDLVLADIQSGAALVDHLHRGHLLVGVGKAPGGADRSGDAERRARSNSSWCREGPRVSLINGLSRTKESRAWPGTPDSHPSWRPPAMRVFISNLRLSAMRTAVSPGNSRTSGAKLFAVTDPLARAPRRPGAAVRGRTPYYPR